MNQGMVGSYHSPVCRPRQNSSPPIASKETIVIHFAHRHATVRAALTIGFELGLQSELWRWLGLGNGSLRTLCRHEGLVQLRHLSRLRHHSRLKPHSLIIHHSLLRCLLRLRHLPWCRHLPRSKQQGPVRGVRTYNGAISTRYVNRILRAWSVFF